MAILAPIAVATVFGALTGYLARRKHRSFFRWFLAGFFAPLPGVLLAAFATPGGEPWRFRAPVVLLVLAVALVGSFVLLAVVAELFA